MTAADALVQLHDVDALLDELGSAVGRERLGRMGFTVHALDKLRTLRRRLAEGVDARWRGVYDRAHSRYGRGLAVVRDRACTGCFVKLPTTVRRPGSDEDGLVTCQGCGRLLFWG